MTPKWVRGFGGVLLAFIGCISFFAWIAESWNTPDDRTPTTPTATITTVPPAPVSNRVVADIVNALYTHRPECDRPPIEAYKFETNYAAFPGKRCAWYVIWEEGQCAMFKRTPDGPEFGPYGDKNCTRKGPFPKEGDLAFAKSAGPEFSLKVTITQPREKHTVSAYVRE